MATSKKRDVATETGDAVSNRNVADMVDHAGVTEDENEGQERGASPALTGHFARAVSGEHKGRYGVVDSTVTVKDGVPDTVLFITRDDSSDHLVVDYADLRLDVPGRR